jgi:exonuclease VII small subunit
VSKQLETATLEPAKKELEDIKASLDRSEADLGRALGE